jgi:peptide deformylase
MLELIQFKKGQKSKVVESAEQIFKEAYEMQEKLNNDEFHLRKKCFALHHAQVSTHPFNFFVINSNMDGLSKNYLPGQMIVICNPKILEKDKESRIYMKEGCMSYPHKQDKTLLRCNRIYVSYDTLVPNEQRNSLILEHKEEWLEDVNAQIFQHEVEHGHGISIY